MPLVSGKWLQTINSIQVFLPVSVFYFIFCFTLCNCWCGYLKAVSLAWVWNMKVLLKSEVSRTLKWIMKEIHLRLQFVAPVEIFFWTFNKGPHGVMQGMCAWVMCVQESRQINIYSVLRGNAVCCHTIIILNFCKSILQEGLQPVKYLGKIGFQLFYTYVVSKDRISDSIDFPCACIYVYMQTCLYTQFLQDSWDTDVRRSLMLLGKTWEMAQKRLIVNKNPVLYETLTKINK